MSAVNTPFANCLWLNLETVTSILNHKPFSAMTKCNNEVQPIKFTNR